MSARLYECPCGRVLRVTQPAAGVLEAVDPRDETLVVRIQVEEGDTENAPEYEVELLHEDQVLDLRLTRDPEMALLEACSAFHAYDRSQQAAQELRERLGETYERLPEPPASH